MEQLTQENLKKRLHYDPQTGLFTWVTVTSKRIAIGAVAGHKDKASNYILIRLLKIKYYAHRLAWLYTYGEMPKGMIDHKDGDRSNNKIANLRLASPAQNGFNSGVRKGCASGYKGVWKQSGKWAAYINRTRIGLFDTPELAYAAYREKALEIHGEFAHISLREVNNAPLKGVSQ
jgi:hypothetical protein